MAVGSTTTDVSMINLVMTAADGSGGVWQDPVQLIPLGMYDDPAGFVAKIKADLPLVNNLRVLFNEHSFNADGSLHPQMEAFLAEAVAQGFELTMCYGEGDAQNIGIGNATWPSLTNAEAFTALQDNYADVAGAWTQMMDWMDGHTAIKSGVYGWELMNESAGYRHSIRNNGAGDGLTADDFVKLYADHANALASLIDARAAGKILVGGWGYNGDFLTLADTMIGSQTALDYIRAAVGTDLVWSAHLYPGWMGTDTATTPAELIARLDQIYAPVTGDDVLVTEINIDGRVDDPTGGLWESDLLAASMEWFAENGLGLGWYPGLQGGASSLLYLEPNGQVTARHQHSLAHAMNSFSLSKSPLDQAGNQTITASVTAIRLRNEAYEVSAGEGNFDAGTAGYAFGFGGNDTLHGTNGTNDFAYGGTGNDLLQGFGGDDFLFGQYGQDLLQGGAAFDNLFGGVGADTLDGGTGHDFMAGGAQNDTYVVDHAGDAVQEHIAEGLDTVTTSLAAYALTSYVENLETTSTVAFKGVGNVLANVISGGIAADSLYGGSGNDKLLGGKGADLLDGGLGNDVASYAKASAGVIADLTSVNTATTAGEAAGDCFFFIESLQGSAYGDQLLGSAAANILSGDNGNDLLTGRAGADQLFGGAGRDTASYHNATAAVIANLSASILGSAAGDASGDRFDSIENLRGSAYADRLTGNATANVLWGLAGNDLLQGGAGADTLDGGTGSDTVSYTSARSAVIAQLTTVSAGLAAGDAAGDHYTNVENLSGSAFGDTLSGNAVANRLAGGAGADTLNGRAGNDFLTGGTGADTFIFARNGDKDRITDFANDVDTIALQGFAGVTTNAQAVGHAHQSGHDVLFDFGAGDTLLVTNTTVNALTNDLLILA